MTTFVGKKGKLFVGKIKLPRSKSKRIRKKWLKRQSLGNVQYFEIHNTGFGEGWNLGETIPIKFSASFKVTIDAYNKDNLEFLLNEKEADTQWSLDEHKSTMKKFINECDKEKREILLNGKWK